MISGRLISYDALQGRLTLTNHLYENLQFSRVPLDDAGKPITYGAHHATRRLVPYHTTLDQKERPPQHLTERREFLPSESYFAEQCDYVVWLEAVV